MPDEQQIINALTTGAVIFGERHNAPAAREMATKLILAKAVRFLLVEAIGDETNQEEVVNWIMDNNDLPPRKLTEKKFLVPLTLQHSGQSWLPVVQACFQQRVAIVYTDVSPKLHGVRLKPGSTAGMAVRDSHMAAHVNFFGNLEFGSAPKGAGILLICGDDHVDGVAKLVTRWQVTPFSFA